MRKQGEVGGKKRSCSTKEPGCASIREVLAGREEKKTKSGGNGFGKPTGLPDPST